MNMRNQGSIHHDQQHNRQIPPDYLQILHQTRQQQQRPYQPTCFSSSPYSVLFCNPQHCDLLACNKHRIFYYHAAWTLNGLVFHSFFFHHHWRICYQFCLSQAKHCLWRTTSCHSAPYLSSSPLIGEPHKLPLRLVHHGSRVWCHENLYTKLAKNITVKDLSPHHHTSPPLILDRRRSS
uniref:Uncharacterized protein n=1 Tax=Setaria viridis TaxID=4556 RepID=A0A4U6W5W4_SETVI|nr:hypothetical protein SEVIR_1G055000v2 [Setaria viridis]